MMKLENHHRFNAVNERLKFKYRVHLKRALKKDDKTIFAALKHLREFELFLDFGGFEMFNDDVADNYIRSLFEQELSLSYINDNIRELKEFLRWLERQRGYRSKIQYNHIDYLNITDKQRLTAKSPGYKKSYTYLQILYTIRMMPNTSTIQRRNKALISLQALCALRVSELRTVKLRNLIEEDGYHFIYVSPKDMSVKYSKTRQANFIALPTDILQNVIEWRDYLIKQKFSGRDPLFPQINKAFNQFNMLDDTITHKEIRSNSTIRDIFRKAFVVAGKEYIRPHAFRHTLARFAAKQSPEFLNAVSKSLGHSTVDTTLQSYGNLSEQEKSKRISGANYDFSE